MVYLWHSSVRSLLHLLLLSLILHYTHAGSVIRLPQPLNSLVPIADLRNITATNATSLSTPDNSNRLVDKVAALYTSINARFPKAFLIGIRADVAPSGAYTSVKVIFTNLVPPPRPRGIVVKLGSNGQWKPPVFQDVDYGVGNKIMWRGVLFLMDTSVADQILRRKYPRAAYKAVFLYQPETSMADQPYWIFTMVDSLLWDKYLWVGVYDRSVAASNELPKSINVGYVAAS